MFLKKAMAWILAAMLVFPLAACGSQPATLSGTAEESASSAGQETTDGSAAGSAARSASVGFAVPIPRMRSMSSEPVFVTS